MTVKVYGLCLKDNDEIRYIGQTMRNLSLRLTEHKRKATAKTELPVSRWIRKHFDDVVIVLLESDCVHNMSEIEAIKLYRSKSKNMLNIMDGGEGIPVGYKHTNQTKRRMSKPKSDSTKAKMSLAQVGNKKGLGAKNSHAVLEEKDITVIRNLLSNGLSLSKVAAKFNVKKAAIWKIKERRTWKHVA